MDRQLQLHRQISRFLDNFKKLGRNNYTPAIVRSRIRSIKELWSRFNDEHALLEKTVSDTTKVTVSYFSDNIYDVTEEAYNLALDHLAEVLEELEPPPSPNRSVDMSYARSAPSAAAMSHLPVIQLAPFDGTVSEWEQFRDRFLAIIIDNKELHDFARMHYLISSLRGRALDCLAGLAISAENFSVAWQTLKDRFDNKRRLLSVHLSSLLTLPRATRESANEIQEILSKVKLTLASLSNLQRNSSELWNDLLVHLVTRSLDPTTSKAWILRSLDNRDPPSFDALDRFLSERIRALEDLNRDPLRSTTNRSSASSRVHSAITEPSSQTVCPLCNSRHYFSSCSKFLKEKPSRRQELAKRHRRCFNCLSPKHSAHECSSKYSCRTCHQRHHSLLHGSRDSDSRLDAVASSTVDPARDTSLDRGKCSLVAATRVKRRAGVILATVGVRVHSSSGRSEVIRALLDQGSEVTLVSERLAQALRAKRLRRPTSICAVGCVSAGTIRHAVEINVTPLSSSSPSLKTVALVLKSLTSYAPRSAIDLNSFDHLRGLSWADPNPLSKDPIDLIIGADLYSEVLRDGVRRGSVGEPIAQRTAFGWIISGPIGQANDDWLASRHSSIANLTRDMVTSSHCLMSLNDNLKRFWELEDVPVSSLRSPEDERCETHFVTTHSRSQHGRYRVRIPFKNDGPIDIGSSRRRAEGSLSALIRRLHQNPKQMQEYSEFLTEYESHGHMRRETELSSSPDLMVYIPHHPVFRANSATSSLRVVFNASSKTTNGTSLNDHILAGPKLQSELTAVILRWRSFRFAYCADITKMYRQILLDERDFPFQRILWSNSQHERPHEYQLLTVTYGMTCAPFLALRVLQQLRLDEGREFPLAARILENNIYVDDVLFGGDSIDEAIQSREQLIALLNKGCFPLRKWSSNSSALLADIPEDNWGLACSRTLAEDDRIRVLGVTWLPADDAFSFSVSLPDTIPLTKRTILSTIAKLYDPLGWVTPVTITAKIFMQSLWRLKLNWDDPISDHLLAQWQRSYRGLATLDGVRISRWTGFGSDVNRIEIHGFSDASNTAYAAVVYCKIISLSNNITISLLAGKSRVAPIKPISVPRLELSAALLLTRLITFVRSSLSYQNVPCYCWSDSTVVLTWLSQHPSRWKVFVAHRVHEIQTSIPDALWRYVPTHDNPADCATRGLLGSELQHHSLWWQGPSWLIEPDVNWPPSPTLRPDDAPLEQRAVVSHVGSLLPANDLFLRFSSWPKLIRVIAYIFKFVRACRRAKTNHYKVIFTGRALHASECLAARRFVLKSLQHSLFPNEIRCLAKQQPVSTTSSLRFLSPFLDPEGILRVGGRISRSPLPFDVRHPILLSPHFLTNLIIDHAHIRALHAGLQLTLSILRRDFWILRARNIVRHRLHQCVVCARERASTPTQLMSDLPRDRVSAPSRAFLHTGLDYAGPLQVRTSPGRGTSARKAYIALFVCLATRAIHLELVSDYSSQTFLNAFARFTARRGLPQTIYSDNGTTFVGAAKELSVAYHTALRNPSFLNSIAADKIDWKFIPPASPHFGGLWEAGVKSVKYHLRRVVKNYTLTIEEMSTLLCRVESCLNSRPIAPLSDSLNDYEPLTPGHFLIGSPLTGHPEPSLLNVNENRLTRWQLVRHMTERFWHHWYHDYVNLLQQRNKWQRIRPPLKVGQLVLIRNSNMPPCKWELGRVIRCHPGADGLTRVATVKTASSELIRPIIKLCILPVDCERHEPSIV